MKSFQEFLTESKQIRDFINSKIQNASIGKFYAIKAPNGKPMLVRYDKIVKNQSIIDYGVLEYGKIAGSPEFYISWSTLGNTNNVKKLNPQTVSIQDAKKLMSDLGINISKEPNTEGINTKPIPSYRVIK